MWNLWKLTRTLVCVCGCAEIGVKREERNIRRERFWKVYVIDFATANGRPLKRLFFCGVAARERSSRYHYASDARAGRQQPVSLHASSRYP